MTAAPAPASHAAHASNAGIAAAAVSPENTAPPTASRESPRACASPTTAETNPLRQRSDSCCGPVVSASAGTTPSTATRPRCSRTRCSYAVSGTSRRRTKSNVEHARATLLDVDDVARGEIDQRGRHRVVGHAEPVDEEVRDGGRLGPEVERPRADRRVVAVCVRSGLLPRRRATGRMPQPRRARERDRIREQTRNRVHVSGRETFDYSSAATRSGEGRSTFATRTTPRSRIVFATSGVAAPGRSSPGSPRCRRSRRTRSCRAGRPRRVSRRARRRTERARAVRARDRVEEHLGGLRGVDGRRLDLDAGAASRRSASTKRAPAGGSPSVTTPARLTYMPIARPPRLLDEQRQRA